MFSEVTVNSFPEFFSKDHGNTCDQARENRSHFPPCFQEEQFSFLLVTATPTDDERQVSLTHQPQPVSPGASPGTARQR